MRERFLGSRISETHLPQLRMRTPRKGFLEEWRREEGFVEVEGGSSSGGGEERGAVGGRGGGVGEGLGIQGVSERS